MENNIKEFWESFVKGVGIATGGGAIALGAGTINLVNADFATIVSVVLFSVLFNTGYQYFTKIRGGK